MDIKIDNSDGQFLEYNALGGILDFYFVAGPSPNEVAAQYSEIVGKPAMQPYWGFGFHQCRYGYRDVFAVAEVVANYSAAGIPLEVSFPFEIWGWFAKGCADDVDGYRLHGAATRVYARP